MVVGASPRGLKTTFALGSDRTSRKATTGFAEFTLVILCRRIFCYDRTLLVTLSDRSLVALCLSSKRKKCLCAALLTPSTGKIMGVHSKAAPCPFLGNWTGGYNPWTASTCEMLQPSLATLVPPTDVESTLIDPDDPSRFPGSLGTSLFGPSAAPQHYRHGIFGLRWGEPASLDQPISTHAVFCLHNCASIAGLG